MNPRLVAAAVLALTLPAYAAEPTQTLLGLPALERADFNRLAALAALPLFWKTDSGNQGQVDPSELVALGDGAAITRWVASGAFTAEFARDYGRLVELRRREAVARELDQGRPTLVETDLSSAPAEDREAMRHLAVAAALVDALYARQIGADGLLARVPKGDAQARALIARNHGPWCEAPETESDPFCNALEDFPEQRHFSYPPDDEVNLAYCERLAKEPNAEELLSPFTVVRKRGAGYEAVPYTVAYGDLMTKVAGSLRKAAAAFEGDDEAAMKAYLLAAAKAFETNEWGPADEAWAAMNAQNSRWYLRIAPDETYFEPCQRKAGFHMSLARVDVRALEWQQRLTELRTEMEQRLADLIGPSYPARDVRFQLPDFINVVINAGDSRSALGATIGQSLPNFGKVADEGRGRTVAMVNLYTDDDSLETARRVAESLFVPEAAALAADDREMAQLDTVLHEATHNLGPYGAFRVGGRLPEEIFGGRNDAILEELKAQTGSLYYMGLLREKGLLTEKQVKSGHAEALAWAFGHIARGMFTPTGQPKTYSQVAAIQVGELLRAGALRFVEGGEGPDPGRFEVDFEKLPAAVDALMKEVGRIKAEGDVDAARALIDRNVNDDGQKLVRAGLIAERVLRYPKASFVYSVRY